LNQTSKKRGLYRGATMNQQGDGPEAKTGDEGGRRLKGDKVPE